MNFMTLIKLFCSFQISSRDKAEAKTSNTRDRDLQHLGWKWDEIFTANLWRSGSHLGCWRSQPRSRLGMKSERLGLGCTCLGLDLVSGVGGLGLGLGCWRSRPRVLYRDEIWTSRSWTPRSRSWSRTGGSGMSTVNGTFFKTKTMLSRPRLKTFPQNQSQDFFVQTNEDIIWLIMTVKIIKIYVDFVIQIHCGFDAQDVFHASRMIVLNLRVANPILHTCVANRVGWNRSHQYLNCCTR